MPSNDRSSRPPSRGKGAGSDSRSGRPGSGSPQRKSSGSDPKHSGERTRGGSKQGRPSSSGGKRPVEREEPRTAGPKNWGSLGRKGAGRLTSSEFDARDSVGAVGRDNRPAPDRSQDEWVRVDDVRDSAKGAVKRGKRPPGSSSAPKQRRGRDYRPAGAGSGGADAKAELVAALGASRGARANDRLRDAAHAFERERYEEARSALRPIAEQAPRAASVRELLGLTYYRLGRWKSAVTELEAFRELTGSTEQHPVLADSYRALGKHRQVEALWEELRDASPAADLVAEGRIVMAGDLADRGELAQAISLLEKGQRSPKRAQVHHLRQAYALADLYERAGDLARARELFRWVVDHEPEFADGAERAASLG